MYEKPPHSSNISGAEPGQGMNADPEDVALNADFSMRQIREGDLLIMSSQKLDC
jgi:hypothetical protein